MFYCGQCQIDKGWPQGLALSRGECEICGDQAVCYDVPSSRLPMPTVEATADVIEGVI